MPLIPKSAILTPLLYLFLLSFFSSPTSSLTIDIPSRIIATTLSPNHPHNLHDRPAFPYGYTTLITLDPSKPLDINDAYICAIETLYHWQGSDEAWFEETYFHSDQSPIARGLQIEYHDVPDRPINMHWYHIKWAILVLLNTMDQRHEFAEARVEMKQHEKVFGIVTLEKPAATNKINATREIDRNFKGAAPIGGSSTEKDVPAAAGAAPNNTTSTSPPPSKTILIPPISEIGTLNITYQRLGRSIPCPLLFNTALDGLLDAATDMHGDPWSWSTAFDYTHKMMYQTQWAAQQKAGEGGGSFYWTAETIGLAARLLPQRLFEEGDCGEVRFRMELDQIGRIGGGSFQVLDFARERGQKRKGVE
ncbi:MAG: hypothetical protein Q9169_005754 [Polycauliona sp. 2 TL-2023]